MKFIVSSSVLLKQLQLIGGVINNSNTKPILDNFLFELESGKLTITASDMQTTLTTHIEVDGSEDGNIAIASRLLLDTLKNLPDQPLTFVQNENNTIEISSNYGKYAVAYVNGDEYPRPLAIENSNTITLNGDVLYKAINLTLFATANDDMRPAMNGVFFEFNSEGLTFVATDAHKLVRYKRVDINSDFSSEFIMPKKPLNLLKNILSTQPIEEIELTYGTNNAKFSFENIEVVCQLINAKYPNYEAVLPVENPNKLYIDRNLFLNSVKRLNIFSNKATHQVVLSMAGSELHLTTEDLEKSNKAEERLSCDFQGDDMEIGFNSRFLSEMLNHIDSEQIVLNLSLPNRAGILNPLDGLDEGEEITMLVMPVMIKSASV